MTGETISHYRILDKLGEGSMGAVYQAEDMNLRRIVAIKFIHPKAGAQPEFRERFRREAHAAAVIDHPNVCQVHEFQESGDQLFIVMHLISGSNLAECIARSRLTPFIAVDVAMQIAQGLRAAHQKGIIHRDLKPGNIMLTADNQVKITDFGLAYLSDRSRLTAPGTVMGTFSYMSPEQVQAASVDRRSDLWSLGCILHEMILGKPPFLDAQGRGDIRKVLTVEPDLTPLSRIAPDLKRIVSKLLQKDCAMRYQHADDLIVDLRTVLGQLPESTPSIAAQRRIIADATTLVAGGTTQKQGMVSGPAAEVSGTGKSSRSMLWISLAVGLIVAVVIMFRILHVL